mmetsp:Transcript_4243/g.6470  ORF Transcript_4243/g.6470 Transcript_4243/m.6470 type:complete len:81 (-) Transcript_4243:174-416(-)
MSQRLSSLKQHRSDWNKMDKELNPFAVIESFSDRFNTSSVDLFVTAATKFLRASSQIEFLRPRYFSDRKPANPDDRAAAL